MWTRSPKRYLIVTLTFISTCICYIERVGFSNAYTAAADAADPNRVAMMVLARLLLGVAQGFMVPSIHSVLAQWVPPHERSRSVSSGMYLGAAAGMLVVPSLVNNPPQSELPKATTGFGEALFLIKRGHEKIEVEDRDGRNSNRTENIPWKSIFGSLPIWNFTFHYALHVMMNWLPTYFEQGPQLSLQDMGSYKMVPYLKMFIFSNIGGVTAYHLITKRLLSVTATRKLLNTSGFVVASLALMTLSIFRTSLGAVICSYETLGFLALGRAGFAVNHRDIAPKYAEIVMGVSNTAGTLAGIIWVISLGSILKLLSLLIRISRIRKAGDQYS
ncbi:hypothetical protein L3X38_044438 [Prunus dulcis]|uniref:Uncharacterized protein n=1 Tax=Prunus dulcis TaxID=3755 RepID=A0AAD4YM71_PRUDU|nr:hypothetical protein L3X38_044438 [Prunus dulcis]